MDSLSIVLPAYNEAENVAAAVQAVSEVAQTLGREYEILVVNDGSKDNTGQIVRDLEPQVPGLRLVEHYPNRGYGGALKAGFAQAKGALIACIPADTQCVFGEIDGLLEKLETENAEIVCGYRHDRQDPFIRRMNALGWNTVVRTLFGYLSRDIDCGFKLFRREVLDRVHVESNGAMIDTEFLAGTKARGIRIAEVPVTHLPRTAGEPTGANLAVIVKAFRDLFRFRIRLTQELREQNDG